jgi:hypothetical protein
MTATTAWSALFCSRKPLIPPGSRSSTGDGIAETFAAEPRSRDINLNASSAMKLISLLSAAALLGLGVFALDLSLSSHVLGSYAAAASILVVLGAVRDYAPRRSAWEPGRGNVTRFPSAPVRDPARLAA